MPGCECEHMCVPMNVSMHVYECACVCQSVTMPVSEFETVWVRVEVCQHVYVRVEVCIFGGEYTCTASV